MLHYHRSLWAIKSYRIVLSLLLVVLTVSNVAGQRRRRVEISSVMQPSRAVSPGYFRMHGRFGGGITPRGSAEFRSPAKTKLAANQLQLVVLDRAKLRNNRPDYDAIGIRWKGQVYQLAAQDDLIYPLMKFIQRGNYIAYTIPILAFDENYFRQQGLVEEASGVGYVAQEFISTDHVDFLNEVDLNTETEELDAQFKRMIMGNTEADWDSEEQGSYVNADFHVKYQVFLDVVNGKRVVDVGGLPLRYLYQCAPSDSTRIVDVEQCPGSTRIVDVEVFKFPEEEFSLQDRAVMFFQTAAILRQFSETNKAEFNRFLREVSPITRGQEAQPSPRRGRVPRRR